MPKPTLLQNLLGKPSRSYAHAAVYDTPRPEPASAYSNGGYGQQSGGWWSSPNAGSSWTVGSGNKNAYGYGSGGGWQVDDVRVWDGRSMENERIGGKEVRRSMEQHIPASAVAQPAQVEQRTPPRFVQPAVQAEPQRETRQAPQYTTPPAPASRPAQPRSPHQSAQPTPPPPSVQVQPPPPAAEEAPSETDTDTEEFVTPPQSPSTSPRNTLIFPTSPAPSSAPTQAKPLPPPVHAPKIHAIRPSSPPHPCAYAQTQTRPNQSRLPSAALSSSTSTSMTATTTTIPSSEDAYSSYSWAARSNSTGITVPSPALSRNPSISKSSSATQSQQHVPQVWPQPPLAATNPAPSSRTTAGSAAPPTQEVKKRRRVSSTETHQQPEWAKDVKWLVPPDQLSPPEPKKTQAKPKQKKRTVPTTAASAPVQAPALVVSTPDVLDELPADVRERVMRSSTSVGNAGTGGTKERSRRTSLDSASPSQLTRGSSVRSRSTTATSATSASSTPASLSRNSSARSQRTSASAPPITAPQQERLNPFPTPIQPHLLAPSSALQPSHSAPAPLPQARPRPRANSSRPSQLIAQLRMSDVPELDEEYSNELYASASAAAVTARVYDAPMSASGLSRTPTTSARSSTTETPTLAGAQPPARAPSTRLRTTSAPSRPASAYTTAPSLLSGTTTKSHNTVLLPLPLPIPAPLDASTQQGYTSLMLPQAGYVPASDPVRAATTGKVDVAKLGIGQAAMATVSVIRGAAGRSSGGLLRRASLSLTRGESGRSSLDGRVSAHALAFSVRTPPPSRVPPTSALVRVYAAALDSLDALLLRSKLAEGDSAFGYIPGRALVGVVIEAGWDCPGVSKGDWVVGLLDHKKPGTLAEFVLVDRRRLYPCPCPSEALTLPQLAVLPLSGVAAYRAARTAASLPRDAKVLVLLGKCTALGCSQGVLCARMLVAQGCQVSIQLEGEEHAEGISRICEADEVWEGEVLRCLQSLGENLAHDDSSGEKEKERFDLVVDCVGGREVWRAARGVLKDGGQFTTLAGDSPDVPPTLKAHIHSNLRSLRRAFLTPSSTSGNAAASTVSVATTKLEKARRVEYEWVSAVDAVDREGEDVRDSLEGLVASAREGIAIPFLSLEDGTPQDGQELDGVEVVTMERAAEAIERLDANGGVVVVKVAG